MDVKIMDHGANTRREEAGFAVRIFYSSDTVYRWASNINLASVTRKAPMQCVGKLLRSVSLLKNDIYGVHDSARSSCMPRVWYPSSKCYILWGKSLRSQSHLSILSLNTIWGSHRRSLRFCLCVVMFITSRHTCPNKHHFPVLLLHLGFIGVFGLCASHKVARISVSMCCLVFDLSPRSKFLQVWSCMIALSKSALLTQRICSQPTVFDRLHLFAWTMFQSNVLISLNLYKCPLRSKSPFFSHICSEGHLGHTYYRLQT